MGAGERLAAGAGAAEVAIPVVAGAGVVIQVAAAAAPPRFTPAVQRPTLEVARNSAAGRAHLEVLPQEAAFTRAPGQHRISQALPLAEEFMRAAARQSSRG